MAEPKPGWYVHFRRRADRRSFYLALGASTALHLSMVTVFSIVIHFPRNDIQYREFAIIPVRVHGAPVAEAGAGDETPAGAPEQLALRGGGASPPIDLPTLEFAELERLRVRQESLQAWSRFDDLFEPREADSWARFSRSLSGLSRTLSDLRRPGETGNIGRDTLAIGARQERIPTHRPAEGFEAHILWAGEPADRDLLFAPPVEALWSVDPATLVRPIEVVLQVNALGKVVNVFSPNVDNRDLIDEVQLTVLQYRFEPLALEEGAMQTATLRIQRAREEARE